MFLKTQAKPNAFIVPIVAIVAIVAFVPNPVRA